MSFFKNLLYLVFILGYSSVLCIFIPKSSCIEIHVCKDLKKKKKFYFYLLTLLKIPWLFQYNQSKILNCSKFSYFYLFDRFNLKIIHVIYWNRLQLYLIKVLSYVQIYFVRKIQLKWFCTKYLLFLALSSARSMKHALSASNQFCAERPFPLHSMSDTLP